MQAQVLYVPSHFPGELDLHDVNTRLRAGTISLDWSEVPSDLSVRKADLECLFEDLDLVEHAESIGSATIPATLEKLVLEIFAARQASASPLAEEQPRTEERSTPVLWLPEVQSAEQAEDEEEGLPGEEVWEMRVAVKQEETKVLAAPEGPFLPAPAPAILRDELQNMVLRDLLGPAGGPEEELDVDRVHERYLVGLLAPNQLQNMPEEQDELGIADEESQESTAPDNGASQVPGLVPSSLGLSFCVAAEASELLVTASWGQYVKERSASLKTSKGNPKTVWKRNARGGRAERIILHEGPLRAWQPEIDEQPDVFVKGIVRRGREGWTVTLFLINGQEEPKRNKDTAWLFQPELIVEAPDGAPVFQRRPPGRQTHLTDEERSLAMLYRRHVGFAVGHGVSVHAETPAGDPTCAFRLSTNVVPSYDVARTDAPGAADIPALGDLILDMRVLAEAPANELPALLHPLVAAYATWITEQVARVNDPSSGLSDYRDVAQQALQQCRETMRRIEAGLTLLGSNADAGRAFAFMNRAMWQQRLHTLHAEEQRRGSTPSLDELDQPVNRSWRPFQLAFILLNLPALTNLNHPERSTAPDAIADLLWFPTGGGKTEAYLGLTAYTLATRRLQGMVAGRSGLDGVAVIMRYTLRLLTLQQFQRAASLICACELIRREDSATWGATPFRLGLWVGQRSTPNTTAESAEANRQEHSPRGSAFGGVGSPRQLTNCPWCGSVIEGGTNIVVESFNKGRGRTLTYCSSAYGQCPFSPAKAPGEGLPVVVVDEEIYRLLPALLIATVDKFAQLPWNGKTQMLFGQVDKKCSRHGFRSPDLEDTDRHPKSGSLPSAISMPHPLLRPPDLIIQDELHLISGPLGSLVGLYETAVDHLATWEVNGQRVRPKVIAATATIRRADYQVHSLFLRKVQIFPPQGLDVEDNFFSRQRATSLEMPGRRYIGICANGRRLKAALIRVYVAYLSAAQVLYNQYGPTADPWMTLVGYFNSMSELGGTRRLVDDDIRTRLWKMAERGLARRGSPLVEELTSRKSSAAIPEVLSKLEQRFGSGSSTRPIDVLLATNMISVGVDVKRLGLMVVTGQPKTTAEYIQATSRVGRNYPGLVCVIYNWNRPRDLSHYEQFEQYHATFYQQVEALSVTPFASRALDRGLAALLTSYVRLTGAEFSANENAGKVNAETAYFAQALDEIARRAGEVTEDEQARRGVRADLEKLKTHWLHKASSMPGLGYKTRNDGRTLGLLKDPEHGNWEPFTCLNSLREVEPPIQLLLDERNLGDEPVGQIITLPVEEA